MAIQSCIKQSSMTLDPAKVEAVRAKLQFGPEIECGLPFHPCGGRGYGHSETSPVAFDGVTADQTAMWGAGTDSTIRSNLAYKAEIKPRRPIAITEVGAAIGFVKLLRDKGAKVNPSCGAHVHVSLKNMNRAFQSTNQEEKKILLRCMALAHRFTPALYAVAGRRARFKPDSFSRPICANTVPVFTGGAPVELRPEDSELFEVPTLTINDNLYSMTDMTDTFANQKYSSVNFNNYHRDNRGLYEVRAFSGTLNPVKALGYWGMSAAILHFAAAATKDSGVSPIVPKILNNDTVDFESSLLEFFEFFGWTEDGPKLGLPSPLPDGFTLETIKTELIRLARKTDSRSATGEEESENEDPSFLEPRSTATEVPSLTAPSGAGGTLSLADFYREIPPSDVLNSIPSNPDDMDDATFDRIWAEFERINAETT